MRDCRLSEFQHTAARRRLPDGLVGTSIPATVSTHSRTKAAAGYGQNPLSLWFSFNTQPHEGGCFGALGISKSECVVSTHSRTKAAAFTAI